MVHASGPYEVLFAKGNKVTYSYQQKRLYSYIDVTGLGDAENNTSSLNRLLPSTDGSFWFTINETLNQKQIGFSQVGSTVVEFGVQIEGSNLVKIENGTVSGVLGQVSIGDEVRIWRKYDAFIVYVNNTQIVSMPAGGHQSIELNVVARLGDNFADFVGVQSDFEAGLSVSAISSSTMYYNTKGGFSVTASSTSGTPYLKSTHFDFIANETDFNAFKQADIDKGELPIFDTYAEYLALLTPSKTGLNSGKYEYELIDNTGLKLPIYVTIGDKIEWYGTGVAITGDALEYQGGNENDWVNLSSVNTLQKGEKAGVEFQLKDVTQPLTMGWRAMDDPAAKGGSTLPQVAFNFLGNGNFQLIHDGSVVASYPYQATDNFELKIEGGEVYYLQNNRLLTTQYVNPLKEYVIDALIKKTGGNGFSNITIVGSKTYPDANPIDENLFCGTKSVEFGASNTIPNINGRTYAYKWIQQGTNTVVSTDYNMDVQTPGLYFLDIDVIQGGTVLFTVRKSYVVGYKAEWINMVNAENQPTSNSIRTIPSPNASSAEGFSYQKIGDNEDGWMSFVVDDKDYLYPNGSHLQRYGMSFHDVTAQNVSLQFFRADVFTNSNYAYYLKFSYFDITGSPMFVHGYTKQVSPGDNIFITKTKNPSHAHQDIYEVYINGVKEVFPNGSSQVTVGATSPNDLHIQFQGNNRVQTGRFGPSDVLLSYRCPRLLCVDLKRELDGSYYYADLDVVRFRYVEEYNVDPNAIALSYKVYDKNQQDVFALNSIQAPSVVRSYGDNRLELNLKAHRSSIPAGFYVLEVTNAKQEKRYIRFRLD